MTAELKLGSRNIRVKKQKLAVGYEIASGPDKRKNEALGQGQQAGVPSLKLLGTRWKILLPF